MRKKNNRVDQALEADWRTKQGREDHRARAYVQRHGLSDVVDRMVDDAMADYKGSWTKGDRR